MIDVKKLTVQQRIRLVMGADCWSNYDLDGKIYKFSVADATIGLRKMEDGKDTPAVAFPSAQMLSHTWNLPLTRQLGNAIANECIQRNVDVILGPGLNIKRTPLNGRNFEYFSEDPYLTGVLGREYVLGVQEKHVGTCAKHFCCNNQEFSRQWVSVDVDERTLREIYLEAFRITCQAKPWSVMCSYNLVNGRRMSENGKLYNLLRNEFGFDGIVISDWEAVKNPQATVEQGLALTMPYQEHLQQQLFSLAEQGKLDETTLNECAQQVVDFAEKCHEQSKLRKIDMTLDQRRDVALQIARQGIVLLKNNDCLPLMPDQSCVVSGAPSFVYYFGGGSSQVTPEIPFIPLNDALQKLGVNSIWSESVWEPCGHQAHVGNVAQCLVDCAMADVTILAVGNQSSCEHEAFDRQTIKLSREEETVIHDVARVSKRTVVVVYAGSAVDMSNWIDEVDAVVWAGYNGQYGNVALAEVLTGKVNPSGHLTETFPISLKDIPAEESYSDSSVICYDEKLNVGYRYFSTFGEQVLFPFGYGLSYSKFNYDNLTVTPSGNGYNVCFIVTNISDVDGYDVPQVYVGQVAPNVYRPSCELKGFDKVFVKAHQKVDVCIHLDRHSFEHYSVADDKWIADTAPYDIYVSHHACDTSLSKRILLK